MAQGLEVSTATIAAIASAPGCGLRGILRLSGPLAGAIFERLASVPKPPTHRPVRCTLGWHGRAVSALVLRMAAGRSYTGEEVLELHTIGSPLLLEDLLAAVLALGACAAGPGEFTRRAYLNGRMDLAQAEAVMALIQAEGRWDLARAAAVVAGEFSARVARVQDLLAEAQARLEAELDFGGHEVEAAPSAAHRQALRRAVDELAGWEAAAPAAPDGEMVEVVLLGRPGAGKSSLFNALAGTSLALVSDRGGTTRDALRCELELGGARLRLWDLPGGDDFGEGGAEIRARAQWLVAVLRCDQVDAEHAAWCAAQSPDLWVVSQMDRWGRSPPPLAERRPVYCSALRGRGLDELRSRLFALAAEGAESRAGRRAVSPRVADALRRARSALAAADGLLAADGERDLAAEELRAARAALGEVVATEDTEDILGRIFASFCIGK